MKAVFIVPLTPRLWEQFCKLHRDAGSTPYPIPPQRSVMVCDSKDTEKQLLIAGAAVYKSDGPWILVENLVANPAFSLIQRYVAVKCIADTVKHLAAVEGSWITAAATKRGLAQALQRFGFVRPNVVTLICPPVAALSGSRKRRRTR